MPEGKPSADWTKDDLVAYAKHLGVASSGTKQEVLDRISANLEEVVAVEEDSAVAVGDPRPAVEEVVSHPVFDAEIRFRVVGDNAHEVEVYPKNYREVFMWANPNEEYDETKPSFKVAGVTLYQKM